MPQAGKSRRISLMLANSRSSVEDSIQRMCAEYPRCPFESILKIQHRQSKFGSGECPWTKFRKKVERTNSLRIPPNSTACSCQTHNFLRFSARNHSLASSFRLREFLVPQYQRVRSLPSPEGERPAFWRTQLRRESLHSPECGLWLSAFGVTDRRPKMLGVCTGARARGPSARVLANAATHRAWTWTRNRTTSPRPAVDRAGFRGRHTATRGRSNTAHRPATNAATQSPAIASPPGN